MKTLCTGVASAPHSSVWHSIHPKSGAALQICWNNLTGTLDGVFTLEFSLDTMEITVATTVVASTTSNEGNRLLLEFTTHAGYYRVRYTPHGITGGTIAVLSEEK